MLCINEIGLKFVFSFVVVREKFLISIVLNL